MKFKLLIFIFSLPFLSCSKNDKSIVPQDLSTMGFPQKWELFKMSIGMQANSEMTGEDMKYQEYYIFKSDDTFSKTRIENEIETTVRGTYSIQNQNDRQVFLLRFNDENNLIGNCSNKPEEYLYLNKDNETLLSNWWSCDGPGLFYKQLEINQKIVK